MGLSCQHCGDSISASDVANGERFCCAGCAAAHALITGYGLDRYYALADERLPAGRLAEDARDARDARANRAWLDGVLARSATGEGVAADRITLDVQGISCAACVWVIEALGERRGVACRVNPGVGRIEIEVARGAAARADLECLLDDVERIGYRVGPPHKHADRVGDALLLRAGVCAALAMTAMIFAFSRYFGLGTSADDGAVATWFLAGEALVATASVVVGGSWFFRSALGALVRGVVHLDLPIALGIACAYAGSVASALVSSPNQAYFDTVSMFIALMLFGRLAQRRLLSRARLLLLADDGIAGLTVRTLVDGTVKTMSAQSVRAGAHLLLAPRELLPVSARICSGDAFFSLAWITGESDAHTFANDEVIPAGAQLEGDRAVVVEATQDMAQSSLHTLLSDQRSDEPDASSFWRTYATASVLAVLTIAALAFALWSGHAGSARALSITTAVLVVTCPCAIGLAIPLAGELASARLRKRGVFVRRPGFFDRAVGVTDVVLDKTGTLTLVDVRLTRSSVDALAALSHDDRALLYNLVARSSHPKSRAIASTLTSSSNGGAPLVLDAALLVREVAGAGVFADVVSASLAHDRFVVAGRTVAALSFTEDLQRDAIVEVRALQERGLRVHIASGDSDARVRSVAARLGVDDAHAHAHLLPEDKAALVRSLGADHVLVIGDGVNDAPAFAAAACAGTPALDRPQLPARADFVFIGNGVGPLAAILDTAVALRRASLAAIAFAVAYNVVTVTLALTGHMTPLLCAVAMPASSLAVVALVTALMRQRHDVVTGVISDPSGTTPAKPVASLAPQQKVFS